MGSLGGGHYTASARSPDDGKWYKFNDSSVHAMRPSEVNSGDVYLLFYVRRKVG
jgi:ubiquitin carboxyl-terminal hydrolase 4/11/15